MAEPKNDPARADRNRDLLNDRVKGHSYETLAEKYGISMQRAHQIVKEYSEQQIRPAAQEVVDTEIRRLERLLLALEPGIDKGNVRSIETAIRLSESLRKLLGVDAAVKTEMKLELDPATLEIEEKLRRARALNKE